MLEKRGRDQSSNTLDLSQNTSLRPLMFGTLKPHFFLTNQYFYQKGGHRPTTPLQNMQALEKWLFCEEIDL